MKLSRLLKILILIFQSRESAMKSFSQKYPTKIVTNVVKDYNDFPVNTKLTDLSQIETYLT